MSRLRNAPARIAAAGFSLVILGAALMVSVGAETSASAQVTTGAYELYCPKSPVGNIVLNDVSTSGTISPADPSTGQQFNLTGYQTMVSLPSSIASAAQALGNSAIAGSARTGIGATGATPQTMTVGPIDINVPIPSPVPNSGLDLSLPSAPETLGPFTATSSDITIQEDAMAQLSLNVSGSTLNLTCQAYPNNSAQTGIVNSAPKGSPIAPVIATAGSSTTTTTGSSATTTTAPPQSLTGAYELYCPGTPVGNIALNDAVTSATLSPSAPTSGQSFSITGYQTVVNLPASLASAAAAVSPGQPLAGSATAQIDAGGATPAKTPQQLTFSVPFPTPIPAEGVSLSLPSTPATIPGFTATGGAITIQEDSSASLTLNVAGSALALTCMAYPNDTVTPSGITTVTPTATPIAPVIALVGGGGSTGTTEAPTTTTTEAATTTTEGATTTTEGATTTTSGQGTGLSGAYELFCPGTPVGNIVLNDVVTTATLWPPDPTSGQAFGVTGYQTTLNLPDALALAISVLSPGPLTGSANSQIDASGATPATTPEGPLSFSAPVSTAILPGGVPVSVPSTPATVSGFTATGGPITITEDSSASLSLDVAGQSLDLTCTAYPNDSIDSSGITLETPSASSIAPVIATSGGSTGPTTTTTGTGNEAPTSLTGTLGGNGMTGATITVPSGTSVTDQATLSGANASSAGGTVTYDVFSLSFSSFQFSHFASSWMGWSWDSMSNDPGQVTVTNGTVPASNSVTLGAGVYFWKVSYSGDANNAPSSTDLGSQTEIVLPQSFCPTGVSWLSVMCFMHVGHHGQGGGDGNGFGNGNGQGDGNGNGNGNGFGNGQGQGDGNGQGNGQGQGNGNGHGFGNGNGGSGITGNSGQGSDNGHGRGTDNGQGDDNGNGNSGSGTGFWSGYWNCHGNSDQGGRSF